jgi:hypothetical protein
MNMSQNDTENDVAETSMVEPGTPHRGAAAKRGGMLGTITVRMKLLGIAFGSVLATLVIAAIGYTALTQTGSGLLTTTKMAHALRNHLEADMMHDALRGDVLFALHAGHMATQAEKTEIQADDRGKPTTRTRRGPARSACRGNAQARRIYQQRRGHHCPCFS